MNTRLTNILGLPPAQPLLPKRVETERPLLVVLTIMAFLAALALLAGRQGLRLGEQWQNELYGTASLQVFDVAPENRNIITDRVNQRLENFTPQLTVTLLSQTDMLSRLEPWLGAASRDEDLPLPLFFALESESNINAAQIENWLSPLELTLRADDHSQWRGEFETVGRALYRTAFLILGLVLTASAVISGFATQSVMSAFAPTLKVIYRSGASRSFVAKLFIKRFFRLAIRGAAFGVTCAVFIALIWNVAVLPSGESLMQRLALEFSDVLWIILLILAFALCCTLISGVMAWRMPKTGRTRL